MRADTPLLELRDLGVSYPAARPPVSAVAGVDLALAAGAGLGIVGESGSGKTQLALAIPALLPAAARVTGSVRFAGEELVGAPPARLRALRGAAIGVVFQDPLAALAPHRTVEGHLNDALRAHRSVPAAAARRAALEMLERVQVPDPARRLRQYPHELSGGLRQRVLIAAALMAGPRLLLADEPTTALDVTVEAGILALLTRLRAELGMAFLMISHDLAVVASVCESVAVMYAGRLVETGPAAAVLGAPRHPYTAALVAAIPSLGDARVLTPLPGSPPAPGARLEGCPFAPRCDRAGPACRSERPALLAREPGRAVACHAPLGVA